jgi:hypothetical protein
MVRWSHIAEKRHSLVWFGIIQIVMIFSKVFFVLGEHIYIAETSENNDFCEAAFHSARFTTLILTNEKGLPGPPGPPMNS